ncbi:hypothetical protein [Glaciecola petra]|uniref:Uncharacterized protein n=1 Tax=Glaciecola petra TaxID=3075602 RepID=A0ABU2ZQ63_9ALTE|nr:hypothetical protein [Aestuariibacter sp. P117]MDT0594766.1 hypothetical protein [Aestuariibacter sp. P117]
MQDKTNNNTNSDEGFFDKERNVNIILYSFYAISILLVALDFVVHRHIYLDFEKIPAFYAIYGFVACTVLVVLAKLMRLGLMRDEDYYDKRLDEKQEAQNSKVSEGQS